MSLPIIDRSARVQYTATAGQTSFVVPFEFFENSNLVVYRGTTQLTLSTSPTTADQYSVTGAGVEGGGAITLGAGATLGDVVTILRDVPVDRTTEFPSSGPFQIDALNAELARIVTMVQQQETNLAGRVLRLSDFDTPGSLLTLPLAAARANRVLAFDADGNPAQGPDVAEVATLAASVSNIAIVAGSIGDVNTVAGSVGSVNTIAPHIGSIQVAATNIAAIIAAPGHAADAANSAAYAANSAVYAEAMTGPTYASTAAGLAATTNGQGFAVDNGDGTVTVYLNEAGVAVTQRTLATVAYNEARYTNKTDLAASGGSALVGFLQSGTGAASRTVQAKLRDIVSVEDFEIVGGVDETAKLELIRQYAIAHPGTYFDFRNIATKELRYTTPKWMAEIQDATFDLRGISLRNLGAGTYGYSDMDAALLVGSGPYFHDDQGTGQINPAKANNGHLIQDANPGDSSVTLVTASEASNYSVGNRVLLRWMERQGAATFPPNPGYFEWRTIKSIVGGVITFDKPLKYGYKAQAPDYTSGAFYLVSNGKARILNLSRSGYKEAGRLRIIGGIGVDTGAGTAGYRGALIVEGAALVEVEDASFKAYFNNCSEKQILRRCKFSGGATEFDKIVGSVIAEDTDFDGVSQGTGVELFEMKGGVMSGAAQLRMREIRLDRVKVRTTNGSGNVMVGMDAWPRRLVQVKDCEFSVPAASTSAVQVGNAAIFTPDAITSTQITVNTTNSAYANMVQNLEEGQVITKNDAKPPEHFYVTGFSFDVSGNLLINGYCEVASPSAGARILWFAKEFRHSGNVFRGAGPKFRQLKTGRCVWHNDSGTEGKVLLTQVMQYGEYTTLSANCYVQSVTVDVVKPYTGTDASCTLDVATQGAGAPQAYMTINGLIAGRRMRNQIGGYGAQAGDTLTAFANLAWAEDILLHLRGTGGTGIFTDGALASLPLIRVVVEGYKPPFNKQEL